MLEKALALRLRRIDTQELDISAKSHPIKQSLLERRMPDQLLCRHSLDQIEVVHHLIAVIALLGLVVVVVSNGRINRHAIDDIAIRLIVGEEPIVVFVAGVLYWQAEKSLSSVDIVPSSQHEANVSLVYRSLDSSGNLPLAPVCCGRLANSCAEVAQNSEVQRF